MANLQQNTLCFTIQGGGVSNINPRIWAGHPATGTAISHRSTRAALPADCYWIAILDAFKPSRLLNEFVIPGSNNSMVPDELDAAMGDPDIIFVVTTKQLSLQHVPQGDWYDLLVKYGAGSELQRIEQLSATLNPAHWSLFGYVLTGEGGPRGGSNIPPPSYELSTITQSATILTMSLMPMPDGQPPYSLVDSYTFNTRPKKTKATPKTTGKAPRPKPKGKAPKKAGSKSKR
jgi:hypothetical protein